MESQLPQLNHQPIYYLDLTIGVPIAPDYPYILTRVTTFSEYSGEKCHFGYYVLSNIIKLEGNKNHQVNNRPKAHPLITSISGISFPK